MKGLQDTSSLDQYESNLQAALGRCLEFSHYQSPRIDFATRMLQRMKLDRDCDEAWDAFERAYCANPPSVAPALVWFYLSEDQRQMLMHRHA